MVPRWSHDGSRVVPGQLRHLFSSLCLRPPDPKAEKEEVNHLGSSQWFLALVPG